jgi:hypothetical protein
MKYVTVAMMIFAFSCCQTPPPAKTPASMCDDQLSLYQGDSKIRGCYMRCAEVHGKKLASDCRDASGSKDIASKKQKKTAALDDGLD